MSEPSQSIGSTLTGGIQDVSAILPLVSTEQCENHVGSALEGGYLYAAAAPLSIFGSLGIVKAGISILITSISIPKISVSFRKFSIGFSQNRWLGARTLQNAGFNLPGTVAPLIAMDGTCYKAETRLLQILEEKHIDNPEDISIEWKSRQWNIMLALFTIVAAVMSSTPYIALLVGPWRPTTHTPWLFPFLRTVGSCLATVCCQFLIQSRVISLMKNRILFMTIYRRLADNVSKDNKADLDPWLKQYLQWDAGLPAEQCLWSLEQLLSSGASFIGPDDDPMQSGAHTSIEMETRSTHSITSRPSTPWAPVIPTMPYSMPWAAAVISSIPSMPSTPLAPVIPLGPSTPSTPGPSAPVTPSRRPDSLEPSMPSVTVPLAPPKPRFDGDFKFDYNALQTLHNEHFPTTTIDRTFALLSWIVLCFSLPATVAGYIGCFTLVSASPGNGPLIWIGLEAALSIFRILVWASNPSFDEETDITVKLKLTEHQPLITTEEYNPSIYDLNDKHRKPLVLVPERRFLEWITPYTGPLDQFRNYENFALYFTLTADYERSRSSDESSDGDSNENSNDESSDVNRKDHITLLVTVFDFKKRNAVTLSQVQGIFRYFDATAIYNPISTEMEANLQSVMSTDHPWRTKDANLFDALAGYYNTIMWALNRTHQSNSIGKDISGGTPYVSTAKLQWKWSLLPVSIRTNSSNPSPSQGFPPLTEQDLLYLGRGYEHELKTELIDKWSRWIVRDMSNLQSDARNDCYEVLSDATGEKAKWELTKMDLLLGWEWTRRELVILLLSIILEDTLRERMQRFIIKVSEERKNWRLKEWVRSEFEIGRQKRLEKEREEAKERMEKGMKDASEHADREGRWWCDQGRKFQPRWLEGLEFIDTQWSAGIDGGLATLENAMSELDSLVKGTAYRHLLLTKLEGSRLELVDKVGQRFAHWHPQRENERREMDATITRIRDVDGLREYLDSAYEYPEPDGQATRRFAELYHSTSKGRACSAIVYDVSRCNKEEVCDVIKKTTTRSVINVYPEMVASIPENDHLLFLSCYREKGEEPAFVQRNRDRWWAQQTTNSSVFYFSPEGVFSDVCYASSGLIAHVFIFLTAPSCVRLHLVHYAYDVMSVSIQQDGKQLRRISNEIPENLRSQDLELDVLGPGKHHLEVVAVLNPGNVGRYYLRDILVEFFNNPTPDSSADKDDGGRTTTIKDRGVDVEENGSKERMSESTTPETEISQSEKA